MKKLSMSWLLIAFYTVSFSQNTVSISGRITDRQTNEALPGATITIKGTAISVITNNEGQFIIRNVTPGDYFLKITFVGYENTEIPVNVTAGNTSVISEALIMDNKMGSDVVVSASKRAEKITNAPAFSLLSF